ncbi:acyl-CoA synthetase [Mesorhizobium carmichaelinearum]|uniref:acyl-CoA synthetase n=1 Tax=Mesorhizobium carmichaelinearum TaxID=1208188 RepID=UPI000BA3D119|nr:acyl-CoA synthetase [Mesorhizobium carmichaelinearum]
MLISAPGALQRPVTALPDIEAFERLPLGERDLPSSTYEMLRQGAAIAPDAPALSFFLFSGDFRRPHQWTHRALFAEITRAANVFRRLGIERGDVIAFVLPNLPETHFVIWGGEAAGIAFAINPLLETPQIAELLRAGKAKWLVTLAPTPGVDIWEKVTKAAAQVPGLQGILTVSVAPYVHGAAGVAFQALSHFQKPKANDLRVTILDLRKELSKERGEQLNFEEPRSGDISSYFCTGGTTGLPKIAARTHASEVFDTWATQAFVGDMFGPGKAIFCGLPLFHVNGQLVTGLAPWSQAAHVVLGTPQGYRGDGLIKSFWNIVEHYRIAAFSGVPTVYAALLQVPTTGRDISSVEYGLCGAAPMPVELFRNFESATGIRILEAYGLTEGACVSSVNPPAVEARIGSIGLRLPYQKMAVMVLDDSGAVERFAAIDEVGVLAINGPNVFAGYVNADHDKGIWIELGGERWLNTGDLARQDADGYFWLTGRRKELIIRGGHNIDPKSIEDALQSHPAVALAAAVGRPDPHVGEVPVVYVKLRQDAAATETDLLAHASANISERAARPKAVKVLAALPLTPVGKIFKPALSMLEIADVVRGEAAGAGLEIKAVDVVQDASRGLLAKIAVAGDADRLRQLLGHYTFQFDID